MHLRIMVFQAHVDTITEIFPVERACMHQHECRFEACFMLQYSCSFNIEAGLATLCEIIMQSDDVRCDWRIYIEDETNLWFIFHYNPAALFFSWKAKPLNRVVINDRYTCSKPREVITKCIHLSHFPPQSSFHRFRIQVDFYDSDTRKMCPGFDCYRSTMQRFVRTAMHVHPPRILGSSDETTGLYCLSSFFYVIFTENCCPDNWYCTFIGVVDHTNK